ncbi:protein-tyrosine phosphatase-like protein [Mycena pura]|uniref:Protein-tyrosine phosphatase-like protein n=1 Tax=Mycena pura TaxID=153505 RepID=A0AAD7E400_9AGAR|nr:protein-tyrosine phosphatase-like protein [Mycena pura]
MSAWSEWQEVTTHIPTASRRLFRASAPNYQGADNTQSLTQEAVNQLVQHGINRVISLNEYRYTESERQLLDNAGIAYLHLPVVDFTAPTLEQIRRAIMMYSKKPNANVLVHCGFGHGRTGTLITAIQLYETNGHLNLNQTMPTNHVERDSQREVLRAYQQSLFDGEL